MDNFLKIIRIFLIIIIFIGVAWFGTNFAPFQTRPVEAKVFERLLDFTRAMPNYLFNDAASSGPVKVKVNGNTTYLSVEKTIDDIDSIFDFYENQIPPQPVMQLDFNSHKIDNPKAKRSLKAANMLLKMLEPRQCLRIQRDDYGFFGKFEFHDKDLKIGSEAFFKKLKEKLETGRIGELGVGRVVMAFKDENQDETTVIKIWTARDFNLNNMIPGPDGDIPGSDIENVARYPGDKRILSLKQENRKTFDRFVCYSGSGSVAGHVLFFHSRMPDADWAVNAKVEKEVRRQAGENLLFFTRAGREVTVQVKPGNTTGEVLTTIIERKNKKI